MGAAQRRRLRRVPPEKWVHVSEATHDTRPGDGPAMLRSCTVTMLASCLLGAVSSAVTGEPPKVEAEELIVATREASLRKLELDEPELAAVKAALGKRDIETAGKAYLAHLRPRAISFALFDPWETRTPDPKCDTKFADNCLAGHLAVWLNSYDVPETGISGDTGAPMGRSVLGGAGPCRSRSATSLALLWIRCFSEFVGSASAPDSWHRAPCLDSNL